MLLASSRTNTGSCLRDVKGSEQEGRETPTTLQGLRQWRMGQRSRRTGKPSTPGRGRMAKAPRLWKDGVQRVVGAQSTQRTRKLSTRGFFSCMLAQWHQTRVQSCGCRRNGNSCFMAAHGDGPRVLRRMR